MVTVIFIDFMGLCGKNPTEFGKNSSHVFFHACDVAKNLIEASDSITDGARGIVGKRGDTAMRELFSI